MREAGAANDKSTHFCTMKCKNGRPKNVTITQKKNKEKKRCKKQRQKQEKKQGLTYICTGDLDVMCVTLCSAETLKIKPTELPQYSI